MKIKKTVVTSAAKKQQAARALSAPKPVVNAKQEKGGTTGAGKPKPAADAEDNRGRGINIGVNTGMRVMAYQDWTLENNDKPGHHFTDTELAELWRREFPESRAVKNGRITEAIVRGVRNLYNNGTGGHGTPGQKQDSKPYILDDHGRKVKGEYTRARKVAEEVEEAPAPARRGAAAQAKGAAKPRPRRAA